MGLQCQQRKTSMDKPSLLQPLPTPDQPNIRVHTDLFGPMLTARCQHKIHPVHHQCFHEVCIGHKNKEVKTITKVIYSKWFCKFIIPVQIHTDGRKEFVNKLSNELFSLLNLQQTKTTPAHPQCNAQIEF